ncbi:MAG TPA: hypothetical protein P5550_12170 [Bacteroidales bacterium]|nr:hypothetical protein [Bacteroidales bacterium]HRZ77153.1 hypothetical protein [Bacteroidales bacterium]
MKTTTDFIAYHVRLIHPEEKIIFWKDMELGTFLMVMHDFLLKDVKPMAWCALPDRLEMVIRSAKPLAIDRMGENLRNIICIYDEFFGEVAEKRDILAETRWEVIELNDKASVRTTISRVHALPVESKLVKKMHLWEHSSFAEYHYEDPGMIEPELIGDIIRDTLDHLGKEGEAILEHLDKEGGSEFPGLN